MRLPLLASFVLAVISSVSAQQAQFNYRVSERDDGQKINYWVVDPRQSKPVSDDEVKRFIVRFTVQPQGKLNAAGRIAQASEIDIIHQQFLSDLNKIERAVSSARSTPNASLLYQYKSAFNGVAIRAPISIKNEIQKLNYVTHVAEDKQVKAIDFSSSEKINAPKVWSELGVTGKDIKIGIIDTGIDYMHADLGGGIGHAFKVKGGYDFVNNDNDPMDDHGHGTHVAGIAAANGPGLKGVAPDANLYAFKVLDNYGSGWHSWILAGIERTLDPDQNPATDDAMDVVNMSLGGNADSFDPLSEAVNNAVQQGVAFVVAAGNSYDYFTILSPGVAKDAITVGATDNNNHTAGFSSKGPVENTFAIKPDVAAPGVGIYSSILGGAYQRMDGTSMASPHVAGAIALLLEKFPGWDPQMLKAVLMNTASTNGNIPVWYQGAGVIDIYKAIQSEFIVSAGSISFGLPDTSVPVWSKSHRIKIHNLSQISRSFSLAVQGSIIDPAIQIELNPSSFTLAANSQQEVDVILTVNTSLLETKYLPDSYSGSIEVTSGQSTVRTILSMVNPLITRINFTGELPYNFIVIGIEGSNYWRPYYPTGPQVNLYLPKGKYDILTHYPQNHTVITEIDTENNVSITLDKSLAKNRIIFKPLDKAGNPISFFDYSSYGAVFFTGNNRNIMTLYPYPEDTLHISDQDHYKYEFKFHGRQGNDDEYYDVTLTTGYGITESKLYTNDPESFSSLNFYNPSMEEGALQDMTYFIKSGFPWTWFTNWNNYPIRVSNPLRILQNQVAPESHFMGTFAKFSTTEERPGYIWETSDWRVEKENTISFYHHSNKKIASLETTVFDYHLGKSIMNLNISPGNEDNRIRLSHFLSKGFFQRYFGEYEEGNIYYKLYAGEALLKAGTIKNATWLNSSGGLELEVTPANHKLQLEYEDYQVGGKFGKAIVTLEFNMANEDKNPPIPKRISLFSKGAHTTEIMEGESAILEFSLTDFCEYFYCPSAGIKESTLKIKKTGDEEWISLSLTSNGNGEFSSTIAPTLEPGYYAMLLTSTDNSNNTLTYELDPAFTIGEPSVKTPYATVILLEPKNNSVNAGTNPAFKWTSIAQASSYTIQISQDSDFSAPEIEASITGSTYFLPSSLEENKTYYWRVKANFQNFSVPWSSVSKFQSRTLPSAILLSPVNGAEEQPASLEFVWTSVKDAIFYFFELSTTPDFSFLIYQTGGFQTSATVNFLSPNTEYFWRVKTMFYFGWDSYETVSDVYHFKTINVSPVVLLSPFNGALDQPLNLQFTWTPLEEAKLYTFQLSITPDFSSVVYQVNRPGTLPEVMVENLVPETDLYWRVNTFFINHNILSEIFHFKTVGIPTSADQEILTDHWYNYPNPFTTETVLKGNSNFAGPCAISIMDQLGKEVARINANLSIGQNTIHWNGKNYAGEFLANGIYVAIIKSPSEKNIYVRIAIER